MHRAYLQCLLDAERLHSQFGIQCIPHGCTQEAYTYLLKGEKHNPSKKPRLMLEDDLPQPQLQLLDQRDACDENVTDNEHVMTVRSPASVIVNDIDDDHSEIDDLEDSADRILNLILAADKAEAQGSDVALAAPAQSTDFGAPADVPAVNVLGFDQSPQPDGCVPLSRAPPEAGGSVRDAGRVVVSMAVDDPSHGDFDWKTFKWGAFMFTSKRPSKSQTSIQGAYVWQASCPFHAKNDKTGCRKSCNVSPLTKENYQNVIYCLKAWCNDARKCKTQAEHMALSVSPTSFPLPSLIEAACIPATEKPTSKVKTDVEIFEDEKKKTSSASSSAAASVPFVAPAAPKLVPKRGPKGKAKAKPKAKSAANVAKPGDGSSSSSSSKNEKKQNSSSSDSDSSSSSSSRNSGSSSSSSDG